MQHHRALLIALTVTAFFLAAGITAIISEAQEKAVVSGIVVDEEGAPIPGANVTLLDLRWRKIRRAVTTDQAGRFYMAISKGGSYLVYVTCDWRETSGVDYVPQRWRVWVSAGSTSTHKFVLRRGASIYFEGEIRSIKSRSPSHAQYFEVRELDKKPGGEEYWTGPVRDYGSYADIVKAIGYDERLVVIPAEAKVEIKVTADFKSPTKGKDWREAFIVKGKAGYFKLSPGELLRFDVSEPNIISNMEDVREILESSLRLLEECRDAGFLVEAERRDLTNSYRLLEESLSLLRVRAYDQSFAKLRSSYMLAEKAKEQLEGLILTSSQSFAPILFIFVFVAFASAHLIAERRSSLEVSVGERAFSLPINIPIGIGLYVILIGVFYLLFPGCRLVHEVVFVSAAALALIVGQSMLILAPRLFPERESGNRSIRIQSALIAAFSMACRNLRRRKTRTLMNLINITVLVFGFITLTSISPGYGLVARAIRPSLPVDALLIRDEPIGGYIGSFVSLPEPFLEWLEAQPNVTRISPKAENSPVSSLEPLGRLYSQSGESMTVLGVLGFIPSVEANITGFDSIIVEGEYLRDDDSRRGVLISSDLKRLLNVDVGDLLYGFGQEFIIRGFFDTERLNGWKDIDGNPILPYMYDPMAGTYPCSGKNVIIVTYEKALTLPKASTSRVAVQLREGGDYESLAKIITLTYDYDVYISHPGSLTRQTIGDYVEEKGLGLLPFLMALVTLNIGASMLGTVKERRGEIASLSSIGLNPTHIAALFVAEAVVIAFIGGGFGYLLGISSYRLASRLMLGVLEVREKTSAEWGIIALFFSLATAIVGSLIPALQSSTLVTPSLLRRWRIREDSQPSGADGSWRIDLPIKLLSRELEPFTGFILERMNESGEVNKESIKLEKGDKTRKIRFIFNPPELGYRSHNEILIQESRVGSYDLTLRCLPEAPPSHSREIVHRTATYVRKLILEWNAKTFEVATSFDPSLSQLYNLVNVYNPTTLYVLTAHPDTEQKLEKFKEALMLRGIRLPKLIVSTVDPSDVEETMKKAEEVVSKADVICISGDQSTLCTALAVNAAKQQKKMICYVVDERPPEEREKNPYQDLEVISLL
jgi:ABC-type lipoprotein release transport system permease subunit